MSAQPMMHQLRDRIRDFLNNGRGAPCPIGGVQFLPGSLPIVHLRGTRLERARAAGRLGRPLVPAIQCALFDYCFDLVASCRLGGRMRSIARAAAAPLCGIAAWAGLWHRMPREMRCELRAYANAAGAGKSLGALAMIMAEMDMIRELHFGCSATAVGPPIAGPGELIIGRNLDFDSFGLADVAHLLQVNHPVEEDEIPSAWLTWLGFWGVFTGWNRSGLSLGCMVVYNHRYEDRPRPFSLARFTPMPWAYARILRQCHNVDDALALIRTMRPLAPNNILLGDREGRAVLVEWSRNRMEYRQLRDGFVLGTNGFREDGMKGSEDDCWRYDLVDGLLRKNATGRFSARDMEGLLHSTNQEDLTIHSAIFEPNRERVHLAVGRPPSSGGPWNELPWDVWGQVRW
jgi:hypothetical protein